MKGKYDLVASEHCQKIERKRKYTDHMRKLSGMKHAIVCSEPDISPRHRFLMRKAQERREEYLRAARTPVPTARVSRTASGRSSAMRSSTRSSISDLRSSAAMFRGTPLFVQEADTSPVASFQIGWKEFQKSSHLGDLRPFEERRIDESESESDDILDLESESFSDSFDA
jgi:hypothetical protein